MTTVIQKAGRSCIDLCRWSQVQLGISPSLGTDYPQKDSGQETTTVSGANLPKTSVTLKTKLDKDMRKKNYRFISLMNLSIKTISKVLTEGIQQHFFFLKMHLDQVGFIPEIQKWVNFGKTLKFHSPNQKRKIIKSLNHFSSLHLTKFNTI